MKLAIYTDGGCHQNPGPGGWAYVFVYNGSVITEQCGMEPNTTNNRMELTAVVKAFEALPEIAASLNESATDRAEIAVYTDSQYVQKGMSQWIFKWKQNNWRNADKQPVKNTDLWQKLDALTAACSAPIQWQWVKGHAGNVYNERCDRMTQEAIAGTSGVSGKLNF